MKTAAILVVYTEAFADTSIQLFVQMVRRIDAGAAIVVVNNHPSLQCSAVEGVTVLRGHNVLHEFGAWQTGLDHLVATHGRSAWQGMILANDTYCHYRPMGALEQAAFVRGARKALATTQPEAHGELAYSPGRRPYVHTGVTTNCWIATYLFVISRAAMDALNWKLHPSLQEVERWAPCGDTEEDFFSAQMDAGLRHHFCAWLFGREQLPRWRRWAPLNAGNHARMQGKAHALVCEQYISLEILRAGGRLRSVFHDPWIQVHRQLLARVRGRKAA